MINLVGRGGSGSGDLALGEFVKFPHSGYCHYLHIEAKGSASMLLGWPPG